MFNQSVVYEQPVNELIRVCLRLEYLTELAHKGIRDTSAYGSHSVVSTLMDMLSLTDRPDLRGKFTKEFMRQMANLQRFMDDAHIDQEKLQATLIEYEEMLQRLHEQSGKFANALRQNEFLTSVRQHLLTPGGACSFNSPAYHYWLQQPFKERQTALLQWLGELEELIQVTHFMLRVVRQSGPLHVHTAQGGFYQTSLDPQLPCQLVRVAVPNTYAVFPEISVGRHGVSIRFYHPTIRERGVPYEKDVSFRLSCCIL